MKYSSAKKLFRSATTNKHNYPAWPITAEIREPRMRKLYIRGFDFGKTDLVTSNQRDYRAYSKETLQQSQKKSDQFYQEQARELNFVLPVYLWNQGVFRGTSTQQSDYRKWDIATVQGRTKADKGNEEMFKLAEDR